MTKKWFVLLALLVVVLMACENEIGMKRFANDRWLWKDSLNWNYVHGDLAGPIDLMLQLETTDDYPFRNLYVRLWTEADSQPPQASLHNFIISDVEGYWYADRSFWTGTYTMRLPIARALNLKPGQKLKLTLVHQHRTDTLLGVRQVGLSWQPSAE